MGVSAPRPVRCVSMTGTLTPLPLLQRPEWSLVREVPHPGPSQDHGRFGRVSVILALCFGGLVRPRDALTPHDADPRSDSLVSP